MLRSDAIGDVVYFEVKLLKAGGVNNIMNIMFWNDCRRVIFINFFYFGLGENFNKCLVLHIYMEMLLHLLVVKMMVSHHSCCVSEVQETYFFSGEL